MDLLHRAIESFFLGGGIMVPLLACSVLMWTLIAERLHLFYDLTRQDIRIDEAIRLLEEGRADTGFKAKGLRARLVENYLKEKTGMAEIDKRLLYHGTLKLQPILTRHLAAIAVLAAVAPLLGLLGTVIGMVDTFDVIAAFGTGNVKALAGGISVALITTQGGLLVAIPGLFLSVYLYRRADYLELRLHEITTVLLRHI